MRRAARTAAAVAIVATAIPVARADAGPSKLRWRLWQVTRVGAAGRAFGMDVDVSGSAPGALALVLGVRGTGAHRRVVTSLFWEDATTYTAAYRDGSVTSSCSVSTCATADPGQAYFRVGNSLPIRDEFLILTFAATARTTFDRPGWRVREITPPHVRRIGATATRATGVTTGKRAVELYEGASAPGGARGSLAWASIPCDGGGSGDAQLATVPASPSSSRALTCRSGETEGGAAASRAVTWTVSGQVLGVAYYAPATRLLVIDYAA